MDIKLPANGALTRALLSFRQPQLKILSQGQADAWSAGLESSCVDDGVLSGCMFRLSNLDCRRVVDTVDHMVECVTESRGALLDLRGAKGNDLDTAVKIAARYLNDGRIIRLKVINGQMPIEVSYSLERFTVVKTTNGSLSSKDTNGQIITRSINSQIEIDRVAKKYYIGKLVVLVDQNTSGAAEVLAQILQTHNRATVVGRKSAGVNTLVTVRNVEGVTVQVPTSKIIDLDGALFNRVKPNTRSWFHSCDLEAAMNAVSDKPWCWSDNVATKTITWRLSCRNHPLTQLICSGASSFWRLRR